MFPIKRFVVGIPPSTTLSGTLALRTLPFTIFASAATKTLTKSKKKPALKLITRCCNHSAPSNPPRNSSHHDGKDIHLVEYTCWSSCPTHSRICIGSLDGKLLVMLIPWNACSRKWSTLKVLVNSESKVEILCMLLVRGIRMW